MPHSYSMIDRKETITCKRCNVTDYPRIHGTSDSGHIYTDKVVCTHCGKVYWRYTGDYVAVGLLVLFAGSIGFVVLRSIMRMIT